MERVRTYQPAIKAAMAIAVVAIATFAFSRIPLPAPRSQPAPLEATVSGVAAGAPFAAPRLQVKKSAMIVSPETATRPSDDVQAETPRIARSGAVDLIAPDVERALAEILRVARSNGGGVTGLNDERPANPGDVHRASVTIGVPAAAFERTLATLSGVARMRSRRVDAEDVGDKIVDGGARLRNLRRTETDLLKIMDRSGRVSEILDVERELSATREQIERLTAELTNTERRVARSQIEVNVVEDVPVRPVEPAVRAQIAGSWHAALDLLMSFSLAVVARGLVVVAFTPYLLALAFVAFGIRSLVRRQSRANA